MTVLKKEDGKFNIKDINENIVNSILSGIDIVKKNMYEHYNNGATPEEKRKLKQSIKDADSLKNILQKSS